MAAKLPARADDPASLLAQLRADYSQLLAAARASVAAARDGHSDPLTYVRAALADHGQIPAADLRVPQLLAAVPAAAASPPASAPGQQCAGKPGAAKPGAGKHGAAKHGAGKHDAGKHGARKHGAGLSKAGNRAWVRQAAA